MEHVVQLEWGPEAHRHQLGSHHLWEPLEVGVSPRMLQNWQTLQSLRQRSLRMLLPRHWLRLLRLRHA